MSTPPEVFDTNNLDTSDAQGMAQLVANATSSGTPFSVIGPNATTVTQMAGAINGSQGPGMSFLDSGATAASPGTASNTGASSTPATPIAGTIANGAMTPNMNAPIQQAQVGSGSAVTGWIQSHLGNWGLITIGVILGLGALLISQKQTLITVGKQAAKAGITGT